MTANASNADRETCLAAGMNDHVGKPINVERLVSVLLAHGGHEAAFGSTDDASQDLGDDTLTESYDSIIARFGGNVELIRSTLEGFGSQMGTQLARLTAKLASRDLSGAASILHTIKGTSSTLGATALAKLASKHERDLLDTHDAARACQRRRKRAAHAAAAHVERRASVECVCANAGCIASIASCADRRSPMTLGVTV